MKAALTEIWMETTCAIPNLSALSLRPHPSEASPPLSIISLNSSSPNTISPPPPSSTPIIKAPHRSHSPSNNLKRSDPFQFGSRYLLPEDNYLEFNAWDHCDPSNDPSHISHREAQYDLQRSHPVTPYDAHRFNNNPEKWWNKFYTNNQANFFKDRKWLRQEFPVLAECTSASVPPSDDSAVNDEADRIGSKRRRKKNVILEVGAGAGNTAFPLLAVNTNPSLLIYACDFSSSAIDVIRSSPFYAQYSPDHVRAEVWDAASASQMLPPNIAAGSVDVVLLIFVFSALSPRQWDQAVRNIWTALRPGGEVCFRDYGRGDLAQVRFRKGRLLEENFYVRGDGTRVYFFEEQEIRDIFGGGRQGGREKGETECTTTNENLERGIRGSGAESSAAAVIDTGSEFELEESSAQSHLSSTPAFEIVSLGMDRRMLVNRQKEIKMYRCWLQGRFRKPYPENEQ